MTASLTSNGEEASPQKGEPALVTSNQRGFTYLAMLFAVAIAGAVVATGSVVWSQETQRDRERELLRIGAEFRRAIGLYYERSPGSVKRYPDDLNDLLLDPRHLSLQRYLRRIYRDPLTGRDEWGLVISPQGGIMGVHSLSDRAPVKSAGFSGDAASFNQAMRYAEWKFVYAPAPNAPPAVQPQRQRGPRGDAPRVRDASRIGARQ